MRISSLNSKRLKISYSGMMSGTPARQAAGLFQVHLRLHYFQSSKDVFLAKLEYVERINCNRNRVISSRERSLVSAQRITSSPIYKSLQDNQKKYYKAKVQTSLVQFLRFNYDPIGPVVPGHPWFNMLHILMHLNFQFHSILCPVIGLLRHDLCGMNLKGHSHVGDIVMLVTQS